MIKKCNGEYIKPDIEVLLQNQQAKYTHTRCFCVVDCVIDYTVDYVVDCLVNYVGAVQKLALFSH